MPRTVLVLLVAAVACSGPASGPSSPKPAAKPWIANVTGQVGLVDLGGSRRIMGPLDGPKAIAFDGSGNLWVEVTRTPVEDTILPAVFEYTAAQLDSAAPSPVVTIADSSLTLTGGLAIDNAGDVWLTSADNCEIVEYRAGQFSAPALKLTQGCHAPVIGPQAIAFDAHGNLWIGDMATSTLYQYARSSLTGTGIQTAQPASLVALPGHALPTAVAFDAAGDLWVTVNDSTVFDYTPAQLAAGGDPTPTTTLAISGTQLVGLAFDASGNLWLTNFSNTFATSSVVELSAAQLATSGTVTPATVIPASAMVNQPSGIAFAPTR